MGHEIGNEHREDLTMQKPRMFFDINFGTLLPLLVAGFLGYSALQVQVNRMDERGLSRIAGADRFQMETKAKLDSLADLPSRMGAVESAQRAINDRLDRITDAITTGQDQLRRDLAAAVEPLRLEVQKVGTKVEVLSDRLGTRSQPTSYKVRP